MNTLLHPEKNLIKKQEIITKKDNKPSKPNKLAGNGKKSTEKPKKIIIKSPQKQNLKDYEIYDDKEIEKRQELRKQSRQLMIDNIRKSK